MRRLTDDKRAELEALVDSWSLASVLDALADICHGKSEHVRSNWQDTSLAKQWSLAATVANRASNATCVEYVSGARG